MPATYDDVATLVQARQLADQIARELETTTLSRPMPFVGGSSAPPPPLPAYAAPPAIEPEELLPPPPSLPPSHIYETWSSAPPPPLYPIMAAPAMIANQTRIPTLRRQKAPRKAKSHLHWAVLAMSIAIAFGLWRDPMARLNAKRQLTTETHRVVKNVSTKLTAAKAGAKSTAKRVSARVI